MTFSIYVHVPFCAARCPYCDFTITVTRNRPEARYFDALSAELESQWEAGPWGSARLVSIYFGGGTPSIVAPDLIGKVMDDVRRLSGPAFAPREVTLEANPEGLTAPVLEAWRAAGVNRISLGAQSFQARHLAFLGRAHGAGDISDAVAMARAAGYGNVSLDLMFGMPGQTPEELEDDLARAVSLEPEHVSAYNLTMESGTRHFRELKRGKFVLPDEDNQAAMFERMEASLAEAGLRRYEISNYARGGFESVHNRHYWRRGSCLGIGTGAHSCVASPSGGRRWWNVRDHRLYMTRALAGEPCAEGGEELSAEDARREWIFLRLRMVEGFRVEEFEETFASGFGETFPGVLEGLDEAGLIRREPGRVALTDRGRLLSNEAFLRFF